MSATVSPRSRIRANARAPSRRCSARRCSASSRTCACRSASPLADRTGLLLGDQEGHHVFPVVGFSFQPLTVHLSLGITHLAAHIVFGLNRGHSGEPTTAWPIGANTSATFVHHEYPVLAQSAPRQRAAPTHFMLTFDVLFPARAERADRRRNRCAVAGAPIPIPTAPVAGPHRSRDGNLAFATVLLSTARFLSQPNIRMASPHSPHPLRPHRAHTLPRSTILDNQSSPSSQQQQYYHPPVVPSSFRAHQSPHTSCTQVTVW